MQMAWVYLNTNAFSCPFFQYWCPHRMENHSMRGWNRLLSHATKLVSYSGWFIRYPVHLCISQHRVKFKHKPGKSVFCASIPGLLRACPRCPRISVLYYVLKCNYHYYYGCPNFLPDRSTAIRSWLRTFRLTSHNTPCISRDQLK